MGDVLTVNGGSHSLHLIMVGADGSLGARLDQADPPGSEAGMRAVREFVGGQPAPEAVGHRLVHGGDLVTAPAPVDDALRSELDAVADLAPLHVPPALKLLDLLRELLPEVPHVLCPDTAFHAGLPEAARTYPLPADWRRRWGLRRYGFHGLSYAYALPRAAQLLDRPVGELQVVLTHLGGGDSVCAVKNGRSVDTSMGFTPLDGVPMSTRSGAVDPGMLLWLLDGRLTRDELEDGLYHHAGLLGLSDGFSGDTRELVASGKKLALDVYTHRVRREIAAAATSLDRLDAIVFTGEIGWDQPEVRQQVCAGLGLLGVREPVVGNLDHDGPVSPWDAPVPVLAIEPREELQIARDCRSVVSTAAPSAKR
jgi:acetate kinase